jgi:multiple sugar transport system permease protein
MDATANEVPQRELAAGGWQGSRSLRARVGHAVLHAVLILLGFTFLVPLLWVISTSVKLPNQVFVLPVVWIPTQYEWDNYSFIFTQVPLLTFMVNTLKVCVLSTLGVAISASFVSYSLARLRWPGRDIVFSLVLATLMLPGIVTLVPTFIIYKQIGWLDTLLPLIVPNWFGGGAFFIFLMRQFMVSLPFELEEAARIDGASSLRILWQIILPLSRPVLATVCVFSFLDRYNDFLGPLIYLNSNSNFTIQIGLAFIAGQYGNHWPYVMAATFVTVLPVIVIFFLALRQFIGGIQLTGLAGR